MSLPAGAAWHHTVITAGLRGLGGPVHGAPERWDWGVTIATLDRALALHKRHEQMRAQMSAEERAMSLKSETAEMARRGR